MAHHLVAPLAVLAVALACSPVLDARADDPSIPVPDIPRIRTEDPHIRSLINDAISASPTVRALVARIMGSDVVVYLACERDPRVRLSGRLNFMSTAGGLRYVLVRMKRHGSRTAAIATLAHELRHAVEIADNSAIVDQISMAREYERIGYRSPSPHGRTFDTRAAVEAGRRAIEELGNPGAIVAAR